jgi:hypothetical protein
VLLAADYPFLDVLWTMIVFFAWVIWIWILISILTDLFRRHDISGWSKALWTIFLIFLPFLGVLVYLIAEGKNMTQRRVTEAQVAQTEFDHYVRKVAADGGTAGEIERAKRLLDTGAINQEEFDALKAKALS